MPNLPHTSPDHDETLIARLAVDDFADGDRDRDRAIALVGSCPACAELQADLRAIVAATAGLPALRRTRDFRLTEADVARLRPTGWRGALARLGTPAFAFTRPLAAGLATLGVAGLLLVSLPTGLGGSASSRTETVAAPAAENAAGGAATAARDAASGAPAPAFVQPQPAPSTRDTVGTGAAPSGPSGGAGVTAEDNGISKGAESSAPVLGAAQTGQPDGAAGRVAAAASGTSPSTGPPPLAILSIVLLVAGVGLWILRSVARRLA